LLRQVHSGVVTVAAAGEARSFKLPYTISREEHDYYTILSGDEASVLQVTLFCLCAFIVVCVTWYFVQFVNQKIVEELGGVEWTLLNRTKYALNIDAAGVAADSVEALLEKTRVDSTRQLVRHVLAWFFYITLMIVIDAAGRGKILQVECR